MKDRNAAIDWANHALDALDDLSRSFTAIQGIDQEHPYGEVYQTALKCRERLGLLLRDTYHLKSKIVESR